MELKTSIKKNKILLIQVNCTHLDASNVREFLVAIELLLLNQTQVILDIFSVRFVDSSGLGALLACYQQIHRQQGRLCLLGVSHNVRALFDLTSTQHIFNIYNSETDALKSFK